MRWTAALTAGFAIAIAALVSAHDLERTQVSIVFARDGSFVVDVANDLEWLKLRLPPFAKATGPVSLAALGSVFVDRVVLFVDGHEVRPTSAEYIPPHQQAPGEEFPSGTYRLRGRLPADAHTLRWYYGLVIDPYPLTIRRADGRTVSETVYGDAWSRTIDVSGQFTRTTDVWLWVIVGLFAVGLGVRIVSGSAARMGHHRQWTRWTQRTTVDSRLWDRGGWKGRRGWIGWTTTLYSSPVPPILPLPPILPFYSVEPLCPLW